MPTPAASPCCLTPPPKPPPRALVSCTFYSIHSGDVHLIDALAGIERKKIYTKSHGGGIVKYTHHEAHVLMSSEKARSNDVR